MSKSANPDANRLQTGQSPQKSGFRPGPDVTEEAERLRVYALWPNLPPKVRAAIVRLVDLVADKEADQ